MKQIIVFLFVQFLVCGANAQHKLVLDQPKEPGKVYYKCRVMEYEEKAVTEEPTKILKFTETKWKVELDTIYKDTLEGRSYQSVLIKESSMKWIYKSKVERRCLSFDELDCVVLAYVEVPAHYRRIYFCEADSFHVVEVQRVLSQPMIEQIDDSWINLKLKEGQSRLVLSDENQKLLYVKMAAGYWSEWKEVICGSCGGGFTFRQIQTRMRELCYYKGPIDGILNEELKADLTKFQKDNDLPVGQLDMKTLKALGVRF